MRRLALLACACTALVAAMPAAAADDPYAALLAPSGTCGAAADELSLDPATARAAMLCLTNYARAQQGLQPLRPNTVLNAAGQAKLAADLSCGDFSHTPCSQPFESVFATYVLGATSYEIGENIAWGTGTYGTPRSTMNGWLHSDGHRENILMPDYVELGVGYASDQSFQGYAGATLWSQEFGVRSPAGAQSAAVQVKETGKAKSKHRKRRLRTTA